MQTAAEASENNTTRTCGQRHPIKRAAKTVQMANMTNADMEIVVHGLDGVWQDTGVYMLQGVSTLNTHPAIEQTLCKHKSTAYTQT
jgi:hypothetical protein